MAVCIAVIGKDNSPQFIACSKPEQELQFHYQVHTSLDIVEDKLLNLPMCEIRRLYLGQLYSTEEYNIYGYATNTKVKFIIIVETSNTTLRENDIQTMFRKLHSSYVDIVSNPFYIPGDPLVSRLWQGPDFSLEKSPNCVARMKEMRKSYYLNGISSHLVEYSNVVLGYGANHDSTSISDNHLKLKVIHLFIQCIRGLSTADSGSRSHGVKFDQEVNLNAGADILEKYQASWAELHESAQENALKAQEVDLCIGKLHKRLQKKSRDVGQMGAILTRLPEVIHSVNELNERIASLEGLFDSVEKALIQFEDLVEIRELQDRQLDHRFQLALYKEKKLSMLENFRVALVEKHAEKCRRHELRQERLMKERQKAFEDQFKHDMEVYKETNMVPKIETSERKSQKKSEEDELERIKLEPDDEKALDEFLRDSTPDPS